jgi:protein involved in polysaccharide export with SLBB domain
MQAGQCGSLWACRKACEPSHNRALLAACALLFALSTGCATNRENIGKRLQAAGAPDPLQLTATYLVYFPDVLEIRVGSWPDLFGPCPVSVDGKIDLGAYNKLRVEGHTVAEIEGLVARRVGVPVSHVRVRILDFQSQPLFLLGQVSGWQRTISYQGQETVLEVLQRVGGISAGAAPEDVFVVRAHMDNGQKPEVFHVDLNAIVLKNDQRSNIRVLPYDQIYVGQSRQAKVLRCVPPWLKPVFFAMWGPLQSRPDQRSLQSQRALNEPQDRNAR